METSLADIKKQYEKVKDLIGDEEAFDFSDEDALRCQDALSLLVERGYFYDVNADGANLYLKQAELDGFVDWLNEAIKESKRLKRREWIIGIVCAVVGAAIGLIPYIVTLIGTTR